MDVAYDWLGPSPARWKADTHTWEFPSGATISFGYLEHEEDKRRYASAEFQFIGFDELTHFTESQYTFLISRIRRKKFAVQGVSPDGIGVHQVPLRMRSASNPGGRGHDWVYARFINPDTRQQGVVFVPAKVDENPHLDVQSYIRGLSAMTGAERERLLRGDWLAMDAGTMFNTDLIRWVSEMPLTVSTVRRWDLAATEPGPQNPDPDWTVGIRVHSHADGTFTADDVIRFRLSPAATDDQIQAVAAMDGRAVPVVVEQEGGASGKRTALHVQKLLPGHVVRIVPASGTKITRAVPFASAVENGTFRFMHGPDWSACVDEMKRFPGGSHDDFVDAASGAYDDLASGGPATYGSPSGEVMPAWQRGESAREGDAIMRPWDARSSEAWR
jgi:predicted phage terminase large subunit-like protein